MKKLFINVTLPEKSVLPLWARILIRLGNRFGNVRRQSSVWSRLTLGSLVIDTNCSEHLVRWNAKKGWRVLARAQSPNPQKQIEYYDWLRQGLKSP